MFFAKAGYFMHNNSKYASAYLLYAFCWPESYVISLLYIYIALVFDPDYSDFTIGKPSCLVDLCMSGLYN